MNKPNMPERILSIDILRGFTILIMVFVNDIASVEGLPWWTYHLPRGQNGLTYVDVVFPAFLFITGMSIPLAFKRRLERGDSLLRLFTHVFFRSMELVIIGVLIMNGRDVDPVSTGIPYTVWNVLMFTGVILFWNAYSKKDSDKRSLYRVLRWSGFILLAILIVLYRRDVNGRILWMNLRNWSILGGIGWAYLSASIIYLFLRKKPWFILAALVMLTGLNVLGKAGITSFWRSLPQLIWPFGNGSLSSITAAGVFLSLIFTGNTIIKENKYKWAAGISYVAALYIAGILLLPFGMAKLGATPSWCLVCAAITATLFLLLHWIVDIRKKSEWAMPVRPAGSNPLLTYILPDIFYAVFTVNYLSGIAGTGVPGVIRGVLFTAMILCASAFFTRKGIRLQL